MEINYLAVIVAALVSMVLGFLWYAPFLFGKKWMATLPQETVKKIEEGNKKNMGPTIFLALVGSFATAYVLAYMLGSMSESIDWMRGAQVGFLMWLGFAFPFVLGGVLWEKKSWTSFWVNVPYYLVAFVVMGMIIGAW